MASLTRREHKVVPGPSESDIRERVSDYTSDSVRAELLSAKGQESRVNWLSVIHDDLAVPSGKEVGGSIFEEILEFCLSEAKNSDISIMAARVGVLSLLWGNEVSENMVESHILNLLRHHKGRGDHFTTLLSCMIVLLASSEKSQDKQIDLLIKTHIIPTIQEEADKVLAKLSGEEVTETSNTDEDVPSLADYLIEFLEAWQACVGSLDDADLISAQLKDNTSNFVQLLQHDCEPIRIAAAHCLLSAADLSGRHGVDIEEDIADAVKTIARVAHDRDFDWADDGKSRKAFESIGEFIQSGDFLVAVDLLPLSAAPAHGANISGNDRRFFEANRNKKGYPIAGYADAAVLEYFSDHLGHNFADLFSLSSPHSRRHNERTFQTMRHVINRHPGARNQSLHVDEVRQYGYGSGWNSRMFADDWDKQRRGHRKVRVADYL